MSPTYFHKKKSRRQQLTDALLLPSVLALTELKVALQPDKMVNDVTKRKIRILEQHHNYVVEVNNSKQRGYQD